MDKKKNKSSSSLKIKNISKQEVQEDQKSLNEEENEKENKKEEEEKEVEIIIQQFGPNPNLLQILRGDEYFLLDLEKFDISKIMMLIDYQRLSMLGESFRNYESPDGEDGVLKIDFTKMIFNLLKDLIKEDEQTDLVYGLHKFFCEIDFNGDGHMEWAEFTQFIIDKVEGEFSNDEKEDENKNQENSENNLIKYKRYELSQNIRDSNIHKADINTISYMNKYNKLLVSENNSHIIKIYNPLMGKIENTLDIHKINDEIEKERINDLLRIQNKKMANNSKNISEKEIKNSESLSKILGSNYIKKKLLEQKNLSKNYYIIYLTTFGSIVALALSNKKIQFYTMINSFKGELLFEITAKSLQKRIWYLKNHNRWFSSGDKEPHEQYFYINELDIDFQLKSGFPIPISNNLGYRKKYCYVCQHRNEIYDVIEIKKPFLILTASLDGLIRLIDVRDPEFLKTWSYHHLGVKHLDFNPNLELNGYIISTGFEYYISLFNTDMSLDESYKGKLEGHFVPVINCRFINNTSICVSVDEEGNVRIWEVLLKTCLQSIPVTKKNFYANGLVMMNRINKFIVYGKIMLFYDSKYKGSIQKKDRDNYEATDFANYPIKICYNKYYSHFYVTTYKDIRIFNKYGNLEKTFKKCVANENFEPGVKIKDFIFEDHYRKFYLSFSNGAIMQYNAGNGSLIKPINQYEIEKEGMTFFKYSHTKDVSSLYFFDQVRDEDRDNLLLLSASLDSTIQVFNEYELETTSKLRTIKGGHTIGDKKCEILCLDFSPNLCQFATGGNNGLVTVWDFEYSKIQDILYFNNKYWGTKLDVLCLKYLKDYPLLFASYSEGICALWGVYPLEKNAILILKFHNFYQSMIKLDFCDVLCCYFAEGIFEDIKESFINIKYFVDTPEYIKERTKKRIDPSTGEELPLIKREDIEPESINDTSVDPVLFEDFLHNKYDKQEMERVMKENPRDYEKKLLIICDKRGFIRILDLTGVFGKYSTQLRNPQNYHVLGSNFNLLKKDDINAETFLSHLIHVSYAQQQKYFSQKFNNIYSNHIIKKEWRGHMESINDITFIEEPVSLVTIGNDFFLRVWDEKLELIGEIDVFQNEKHKFTKEILSPWHFKVDERVMLKQEINEIIEMIEEVGIKPIKIGSKEDEEKISKFKNVKIEENIKKIKQKKNQEEIKEESKTKKENSDNKKDLNEFTTQYENLFLQNLISSIDFLLQNKSDNQGFGKISNNLIDSIIIQKAKEKINMLDKLNKKKKGEYLSSSFKYNKLRGKTKTSLISEKESDIKSDNIENEKKRIKKGKGTIFQTKFGSTFTPAKLGNLILSLTKNETNLNRENSKKISQNTSEIDGSKNYNDISNQDIINSKNILNAPNDLSDKMLINQNIIKSSIRSKFNSMNNSTNNFSLSHLQTKLKRNFSTGTIRMSGLNSSKISKRPKTGKDKHQLVMNFIPNNINRNTLYSEKFFNSSLIQSQKKSKIFPSIKKKFSEIRKYNNLLNINMKERTEDLVKTQFYLNSYKNCCKILPNNSLSTNASIMLNYKNMWNNVKSYTNSVISKNSTRYKITTLKRKKLTRSRSVLGSFHNS